MKATERTIIKYELTESEIRKAVAEYLGKHQEELLNEVVREKDVYFITEEEHGITAIFEINKTKDLTIKK